MTIITESGKNYVVEFQHFNNEKEKSTLVKMFEIVEGGKRIFIDYGLSYCRGRDNFSKGIGRRHAMKNLFKKTDIDKEDRIDVWDTYFSQHEDFFKNYR